MLLKLDYSFFHNLSLVDGYFATGNIGLKDNVKITLKILNRNGLDCLSYLDSLEGEVNESELFRSLLPQQRNSTETQFSGQKSRRNIKEDKSIFFILLQLHVCEKEGGGKFHQIIMHHIVSSDGESLSYKTFIVENGKQFCSTNDKLLPFNLDLFA